MICPFCNQEHPDNYQFCPITGKKFSVLKACSSPMCPDYGKPILPLDSMFCPRCGMPLRGNNCEADVCGDERSVVTKSLRKEDSLAEIIKRRRLSEIIESLLSAAN